MYYLGIYLSSDPERASAYAIIEKELKNLKKHYTVLDVNPFPVQSTLPDIETKIEATYNDRSLLVVKKVFSQDRRPSKKVAAFPTIVCGVDRDMENPFSTIRKKEIPVERLFFKDASERSPEKRELTLGDDYFVQREMAFQTLLTVISQKRLKAAPELLGSPSFIKNGGIEIVSRGDGQKIEASPDFHCLMALAAPLWFAETVRKIIRY